VDGYSTRYVHDGGHVIAEYDGNNNLLRRYIYGPGIDQPVCMIEVADANAVYYYHFDALGSVVALSDAAGDTVQTYEYSVYGEVAVEDANHTNPYMFAGRRFDIEIGLYYNRARYYNSYTGRFLQTDPIGYGDGMNMYAYCTNNPLAFVDPTGYWASYSHQWVQGGDTDEWRLAILCWDDAEQTRLGTDFYFAGWDDVWTYVQGADGDFCDVSFDMDDWEKWAISAEASDSGPPDWVQDSKAATFLVWADVLGICGEFGQMDTFDPAYANTIINPYPDMGVPGVGANEASYDAVHYGVGFGFGLAGIDETIARAFMEVWEMTEPGIWTRWGPDYQGRNVFEGGPEGVKRDMENGMDGYGMGSYTRPGFWFIYTYVRLVHKLSNL
jgi:RHS repeat-associated protein